MDMPAAGGFSAELIEKVRASLQADLAADKLEIPLLPDVAVHILSNPLTDDTDINSLSDLIQRDQALAAHVLRVVNSIAFSGGNKLGSLKQAVVRLGLENLRELVVSVAFKSRLFDSPKYEAVLQDIWQFSAVSAAYAKEIAHACALDAETCFVCGLMHNVGKPPLLMKLVDMHLDAPEDLDRVALLEAFPDLQLRAGERIAEKWSLPEAVKTAIKFQIRWQAAADFAAEAKATHLATIFATFVFSPNAIDTSKLHEQAVCKALGLSQERVAGLLDQRDKVAAFAESFG